MFALDSLPDTLLTDTLSLDPVRRYWWKVISRDHLGLTSESGMEVFRTYRPGDVNESWSISSADIITLVNYVFKGQALTVPECAGDVNTDTLVSSPDIIYLVNTVFKAGPEPEAGCPP